MKINKIILTLLFLSIILKNALALSAEIIQERLIDDFSNLNLTSVHSTKYPQDYQELASILAYAQKQNLKISVAGKRHSQGGHTFYDNAIIIDTRYLNKIISLTRIR